MSRPTDWDLTRMLEKPDLVCRGEVVELVREVQELRRQVENQAAIIRAQAARLGA